MKKLFMLVLFLCSCVLCAEPDSVESIPFKISKWKERRTTIKGIGPVTLWGSETYSYKGNIKFDGKKYRANLVASVVSNSLQPYGLYVAFQATLFMGFSRQEY